MYIAMNMFRVVPDKAEEFERVWKERDSYLDEVPGFGEFKLLKGAEEEGAQLYSSHTTWDDEAAFRAWTESEAFRKAHSGPSLKHTMAGPPRFFGWSVIG